VYFEMGQPQGIAPTQCHVGAIPCGCPLLGAGINLTFIFWQPQVATWGFYFLATPGCHLGLFTFSPENPFVVVLFKIFINLPLYFLPLGKLLKV